MIFFLAILPVFLLISQLPVVDQDVHKVVGHEPIHAKVGDNVTLPCHLEPPFDVTDLTIEWKFQNHIIRVHRSKANDDETSDPKYKGRASFFTEQFVKGNISLKLTNVTKEDEGNYTCLVPKLERQVRKGKVALKVDENGAQGNSIDPQEKEEGNKNVTGIIIGVAVGGVVFVVFVVIVVIIALYKRCTQIFSCQRNNHQNINNRERDQPLNPPQNGGGNDNAEENNDRFPEGIPLRDLRENQPN